MIEKPHLVKDLEAEFLAREKLPYKEALHIFESLWREGVTLGVLPPEDPSEGLEVDLRIAKVLNSCSRNSSRG
jgi:hypothetical protein